LFKIVAVNLMCSFRTVKINFINIYSPKGLLGTPVQFLINSIIQSTNHITVA